MADAKVRKHGGNDGHVFLFYHRASGSGVRVVLVGKVYNAEGELQYKIQYRNGKKVWAQEYDESGNTTAFNYK